MSTTRETQPGLALDALKEAGEDGLTVKDIARLFDRHDETAVNRWGPTLTDLRDEGLIVGLREFRERAMVNVLPTHVAGRKTQPRRVVHCTGCRCGEDGS